MTAHQADILGIDIAPGSGVFELELYLLVYVNMACR